MFMDILKFIPKLDNHPEMDQRIGPMQAKLSPLVRTALLLVALCLTVIAYYRGLSGDYVFDDFPNIVANREVHVTRLDVSALRAAMFSDGSGFQTRPLSMLTFALNYDFFGPKPFSFKAVNLVIHLFNGIGLFILANLILGAYRRIYRPQWTPKTVYFISLATASAWLLHPLNLTAVLYVVQRMTSLAALFMICSLCFYVWGRLRIWETGRGLHLILIGLLLFGSLAMLSKENGALLPLYMFVIELSIFRFRNQSGQLDRKIAGFFITGLLLAIGCLIWLIEDPQRFLAGYALRPFTMGQRLLTEGRVLIFYLRMIFAPSLGQLGLYHDDFALSRGWLNPLTTLPSVAAVIALFFSGIFLARKHPIVGLGILWFFAGHVLESTFLPLEIAFEHRNYIADFGILLVFFFLLLNPAYQKKTLLLRRISAVLFIGLYFGITFARAQQWGNGLNQAVYEAAHHPDSVRANYDAGRFFANLTLNGHKQFAPLTFSYLEKSRKLDQSGILADVGLIFVSSKLDKPLDPSLVPEIEYKLSNYPISPSTILSLREFAKFGEPQFTQCHRSNCRVDQQQLESVLQSAMKNPWVSNVRPQYADLMTLYGTFLINQRRDMIRGKHYFEAAVKEDPGSIQYRINLVQLLLAMGLRDEARRQTQALEKVNSTGEFPNQIASLKSQIAGTLPKPGPTQHAGKGPTS